MKRRTFNRRTITLLIGKNWEFHSSFCYPTKGMGRIRMEYRDTYGLYIEQKRYDCIAYICETEIKKLGELK